MASKIESYGRQIAVHPRDALPANHAQTSLISGLSGRSSPWSRLPGERFLEILERVFDTTLQFRLINS